MRHIRGSWVLLGGGAIALLVGAVWLGSRWFAQAPPPVTVGSTAPEFRVASIQPAGPPRTLAEYGGHPLLLNFWATWCQPCREEMPSFERLYRADSARGLRIVAISIDAAGADAAIRAFIRSYGITFDVLHDARSAVMARYQVRGVPETFLIRADGRIAGTRYVRDWDSPASAALVDSLLLGAPRAGTGTGASGRGAPIRSD